MGRIRKIKRLSSGDTTKNLFSKIKQWFAALGSLAFKSSITNSDVSSSAAIDKSKISGLGTLAGKSSITSSDIDSGAIIASKMGFHYYKHRYYTNTYGAQGDVTVYSFEWYSFYEDMFGTLSESSLDTFGSTYGYHIIRGYKLIMHYQSGGFNPEYSEAYLKLYDDDSCYIISSGSTSIDDVDLTKMVHVATKLF